MTALIAIKYGDLTDTVTVTEDAVITEAGATLAGIHPGDQLTMEQLLLWFDASVRQRCRSGYCGTYGWKY